MNRVLIVTGDPACAGALKDVLRSSRDAWFESAWARDLADAQACLRGGCFDAILADLALPDSAGIASFEALAAAAPRMPILTIGGKEDQALADEALRRGAHGQLSRAHCGSALLPQTLRNIIARQAVEAAQERSRARAAITLDSIGDAVIGVDLDGMVDYLNAAACELTGWSPHQALGRPIAEVMPLACAATGAPLAHPVTLVLGANAPATLAPGALLHRRDGGEVAVADSAAPIHDGVGRLVGAVIVFREVGTTRTPGARRAQLTQHDFLTELPNRALLNDRIGQAVAQAQRCGGSFALLCLGLDAFKQVNATFGRASGDLLLQSVARRLRASVRGADTVSRSGGDGFVVLLADIADAGAAAVCAGKLLAALAPPHTVAGADVCLSAGIGSSIYPGDGQDADTLLKNAGAAMQQAKATGCNTLRFAHPEATVRAFERQLLDLDRA